MNPFQEVFDKQKAYFDSDATKSYEWRIEQLNGIEHLCNENSQALEDAMSSDFKTASQENVFEIMAPVGTVAVTFVAELTVNVVAFTPPKVTFVVCVRPVPLIIT